MVPGMPAAETPEQISRTRTVTARAILQGRADLRTYPYRLLAVVSHHGLGGDQISEAVAAAEVLGQFGWDLVNVSEFGSNKIVYAFLRRR
ncbi:putative transcriptional regulator, GntR family [Micromonospora lupini str. Lupac 08]|uniref:Putative transcriptional regulator, GntR family n=2 Tax=Micromonospora lupini TaxID=285679 RepID=I0L1L1_9ACTN|nr:putative transcriptional regulator, GntR family [Micromonospora lupini str. Lupac 08]